MPHLTRRLLSVHSIINSDPNFRISYSQNTVTLLFQPHLSITLPLPRVTSPVINETTTNDDRLTNQSTQSIINDETTEATQDDTQAQGGSESIHFQPTRWNDVDTSLKLKRRMDVELAHNIFGHRSISSLLNASQAKVWDDIQLIVNGDSWCDSCKIAIAPKSARSKLPMRFNEAPMQVFFMDMIPNPGIIRHIPEYSHSVNLLLVDPVSKYIKRIGLHSYETSEIIEQLSLWRGDLNKQGLPLFIKIRADAGTYFTSDEFTSWCGENNINWRLQAQSIKNKTLLSNELTKRSVEWPGQCWY